MGDIRLRHGEAFARTIRIRERRTHLPVDLTGSTFTAAVLERYQTDNVLFTLDPELLHPAADGRVYVEIDAGQVLAIPISTRMYMFYLRWVDALDTPRFVLYEALIVEPGT